MFILMGLALRLWVWSQPPQRLLAADVIIDDTYYALAYAQEFAQGHPFRVGEGQTGNGFQPLYVFLITPIFFFCAPGEETATRAALAVCLLFSILAVIPIFIWARRLGGGMAGLIAAMFAALSPPLILHGLNGLETSLNLFLLALFGALWPRLKARPVALGFMLGLVILGRVDCVLLLPVVGALLLLEAKKNFIPPRRFIREGLISLGVMILTLAPYLLSSLYYTGHATPQSGRAVRLITKVMGSAEGKTFFPLPMVAINLRAAFNSIFGLNRIQFFPGMPSRLWGGTAGIVLCIVLAFGLSTLAWIKRKELKGFGLSLLVGISLLSIWVAAYVFYVGGLWFYDRYFLPVLLLTSMGIGWIASRSIPQKLTPWRNGVGAGILLLYASMSVLEIHHVLSAPYDSFETFLPFVREQVAKPGERFGMFQSGFFNYRTRGRVINLDGVANIDASRAMADKTMDVYLKRMHITEVMDEEWILERQLFGCAPPASIKAERLFYNSFAIYRIRDGEAK